MKKGRHLRVISANAPRTYSKITRKTSRKITMNGKRSLLVASARINPNSDILRELCNLIADSSKTGITNSSLMTVIRKMHPNTASVL